MLALHPASGKGPSGLGDAREALRRGDGIAAEATLRNALRHGTAASEVAALMGEAELLQEDLGAARRWLAPEDFAQSERAHGYRMLGRLEMASGNLPAAGAAFDHALAMTPGDPQLWVDIGRLRYRGGEHLQAIDAADRALALRGDDPAALIFRGQLVRDGRGPIAALPLFAKAVLQAPEDLGALYEYAATLGEAGRAQAMLTVTRRMIELDAGDPRAFYLQAVLATRAGKHDLARRLLWQTGETYRKIPAALMLQGVLELRSGNAASALEAFETLWWMQPDNARAAELVARALAEQRNHAELTSRFGPLALRADASPYLRRLVDQAYEGSASHHPAEAVLPQGAPLEVLDARWRHAPGEPGRFIPLVRELVARRDHAAARRVTGQLVQRFPGSGDVHFLAGDVERMGGQPARALAHYRIAARVRMSRGLLTRMMAAERDMGRPDRAKAMVREYSAQHPMDSSVAHIQF